jgi:heterodisulfide reductase subunit C
VGIREDHLPRLNTSRRPIVNQYREGKVKSTPVRGVKEYLKPFTYKQWKGYAPQQCGECLTACLLHNEPASYSRRQG